MWLVSAFVFLSPADYNILFLRSQYETLSSLPEILLNISYPDYIHVRLLRRLSVAASRSRLLPLTLSSPAFLHRTTSSDLSTCPLLPSTSTMLRLLDLVSSLRASSDLGRSTLSESRERDDRSTLTSSSLEMRSGVELVVFLPRPTIW